ncbi:MAG: FecCD family ABC transporter permease [Alloprevotella sp.]
MPTSQRLLLWFLALLLPLLAAAGLVWGSVTLPLSDVWAAFCQGGADSAAYVVVVESRLPSVLTAGLAGMALAAAGLVMQTVFQNPLADPSILGVGAGSGLGVAVVVLWLGGSLTMGTELLGGFLLTLTGAVVGAGAVLALLAALSVWLPGRLHLLVAGVMVSFLAGALTGMLSFFASAEGVQRYVVWGLGSFDMLSLPRVEWLATVVAVSVFGLLLRVKSLDALLLGADYAAVLGFSVQRERTWLLLLAGVLTAVVTACCGPVSFVGLAVPALVRLWYPTADTHRVWLPVCLLAGADVALLCHLLCHIAGLWWGILPIGVVTPLIGAPVVIVYLLRNSINS